VTAMGRSRGLVLAVVVGSLVIAGGASSAQADTATPKARMMTKAQVPASFGVAKNWSYSKKPGDAVKTITLCSDAEGTSMFAIPAPKTQYFAESEVTPKKRNEYVSVNERVYRYPSAADAAAAYLQLSQGVTTCTGTKATAAGTDPHVSDVLANGSSPGGQYQNFWVTDSTTYTSKDPQHNGRTITMAVYSQAGNAIIQTGGYINGRPKLTTGQADDLQTLAMTLSSQWSPQ
jgi:hypothetical protein